MVIGLTGGIGTGKTTVCKLFSKLGVPIIISDKITMNILYYNTTIYQAMKDKFGNKYLDRSGHINRKKLRGTIFTNSENKQWLENLLHPLIKNEIKNKIKNIIQPYCIVEIPLLIEVGWQYLFNRILTIDCPKETQIYRVIRRDNISSAQVISIIANQITSKERCDASNDVIQNIQDIKALRHYVGILHKYYLELAASSKY